MDEANAGDEPLDVYPPDDESGAENHVPRANRVRARALAQQGKTPSGVAGKAGKMRGGNRKLLAQQKRKQALELRKSGATFDQIATALGYKDASGARKAVKAGIDGITQEDARELKIIQTERYNHMLLTLWSKVQLGDERAIQTALGVMDRINDLSHLRDQSVTINVDASKTENAILVIDGDKEDYIAAMKRMVGVSADGTNDNSQAQITAHPAEGELPEMDHSAHDVVEGTLMDNLTPENVDFIHAIMSPPEAGTEDPPKKKFNLSVEPTVRRTT